MASDANPALPALLNSKQVTIHYGIPPRSLARLVSSNAIPSTTVGRSRLFPRAALELWIVHGCPDKPGDGERILHELRTTMMASAGARAARNSRRTPAKARWVSGDFRRANHE